MTQSERQKFNSVKTAEMQRRNDPVVITWIPGAGCVIQFLKNRYSLENFESMKSEEEDTEIVHLSQSDDLGYFFGVRCDWDVALLESGGLDLQLELQEQLHAWHFQSQELMVQPDHFTIRRKKISNRSAQNTNEKITYINEWQLQLQALYPNDIWGIYNSYSKSAQHIHFDEISAYHEDKVDTKDNEYNKDREGKENIGRKTEQKIDTPSKNEIVARFSPEHLGCMFVSHAHTDHSPVETESPLIQTWYEDGRLGVVYPFPIICTAMTSALIQQRFNRDLIMARKWPNFPVPQNLQLKWQNLIQLLIQNKNMYIEGLKGEFQRRCMEDDYFIPHAIPWGCWWLIPNGHIIGSASLCLLSWESLNAEYNSKMDSTIPDYPPTNQKKVSLDLPYSDVIYIGEANTCAHPHVTPLPPVKAHTIVVEDLFGDPRWNFPDQDIERERLKEWIKDTIQHHSIVVICHELGKSQLIWMLVEQLNQENANINVRIPIIMPMEMWRVFKVIQTQVRMPMDLWKTVIWNKSDARKQHIIQTRKVILFATPNERSTSTLLKWINRNHAKIIEITGWCQNAAFRQEHPADAYFSLTDHFTFDEMLKWLNQSQIDEIRFTGNIIRLSKGEEKEDDTVEEEYIGLEKEQNQKANNILSNEKENNANELDELKPMTGMLAYRLYKMGWNVGFLSSWEEDFFGIQKPS